jgi:hypothetical protein
MMKSQRRLVDHSPELLIEYLHAEPGGGPAGLFLQYLTTFHSDRVAQHPIRGGSYGADR